MTDTSRPEPVDTARIDRTSYAHSAVRRLILQEAAVHAADGAMLIVEDVAGDEPGDLVARAVRLADLAQTVLIAAVVAERELGTSWRVIGAQLPNNRTGEIGVSAQAAEGTYGDDVRMWHEVRNDALAPRHSGEPVLHPGAILASLREWATAHNVDLMDTVPAHPSYEVANVIALTAEAVGAGWTGERLAAVYDRRADAYRRLAEHIDDASAGAAAAEEAQASRARAAELRANA